MYPENLKYSREHEWVSSDGKIATVGITHHAQDSLGDIVYVELPAVGKELAVRQEFGVVESVKSVSSLFCPVAGRVMEINAKLNDSPQLVNDDPYGQGWLIKVSMTSPADLNNLLSAADYRKLL
jgi:glycine cleavage system H protein